MTDASNSQYTAIGSNLNLAEGATATVGAITVNFNDLTLQRLARIQVRSATLSNLSG